MSESINSSRRTAGSIRSISTSSSRASEGYISDVERGEKTATRFSRRTPSAHGDDHGSARGTPQANQEEVKRKREFKGRHIQMMAIGTCLFFQSNNFVGGTIGTGVLLQSGRSLYYTGPVSILIAYLLMATVVYSVLVITPTSNELIRLDYTW
jgi:amino acid permease